MNRRVDMNCSEIRREQFYQICQDIVQQIMGMEGASFFFKPVDQELDGAPDYYEKIDKAMCIFTIQDKLDKKLYNTSEEFIGDMNQVFKNAQYYNADGHPIYKAAIMLANKFSILSARLPRTIQNGELNGAVQREVELRFLRYRLNKNTHL